MLAHKSALSAVSCHVVNRVNQSLCLLKKKARYSGQERGYVQPSVLLVNGELEVLSECKDAESMCILFFVNEYYY